MLNREIQFKQYIPIIALINLALSGTLCVYSVMSYLNLKFSLVIGMICMGIILGVYLFNRFTDLIEDFSNKTNRGIFVIYKSYLKPLSIMLILVSIIILIISEKINLYHLVLISLGIMYSFPLIPWFKKNEGFLFIRLKQIPFIKNVFVALLWGLSIFIIPILFSNTKVINIFPIVMLIASQIIATLSNTLFSDIRDVDGDKFAGNLTLPIILGVPFSFKVIYITNLCWFIILTFFLYQGSIDLWHYVFFTIILMYTPMCILLYKKEKLSNGIIDLIGDFDLLVYAIGIKILSLV